MESPNNAHNSPKLHEVKFIDLFAGLGGFRLALERLGHECVFASELDQELQELYKKNFCHSPAIEGDIRQAKDKVPAHDVLCAGFPCQPFSKSGDQAGLQDPTSGTLFHEILEIAKTHNPRHIILENVGNLERHDQGRTWQIARTSLEHLGYVVQWTRHKATGGNGLLSPHHLGYPHHRERFYAIATLDSDLGDPFPLGDRTATTSMSDVVQDKAELSIADREETGIVPQQLNCIEHWNRLLQVLPDEAVDLPSFPIWTDEFGADYTFEQRTPWYDTKLRVDLGEVDATELDKITYLPSYARVKSMAFPKWKTHFIRSNRAWFGAVEPYLPANWLGQVRDFPPSLRKLEWNCKGERRDLWSHILQFRPSGLRVKRYENCPSLVAMTSTQIPVLGPERRHLTRVEGLRLQGFPDDFVLPVSRNAAFRALGNAVHVRVVERIASNVLGGQEASAQNDLASRIVCDKTD
jgi:DNA (cytosine-5)-methyltransferase 1